MHRRQKAFGLMKIIILLVIVGVFGAIGAYFYKQHQTKNNNTYFTSLSSTAKANYQKQANALGVEITDTELEKRCYRSGQGPFDNGGLRCGILVNKKINVQPDQVTLQSLLNTFVSRLESQGYSTSVSGSANGKFGFSVRGNKRDSAGAVCTSDITYSPGSTYPDAKTTMELRLDCSNVSTGVVNGFIDESDRL